MNKKMRELQAEILEKTNAAKALTEGDNQDYAKASELLDQVDELQKKLETEARLAKLNVAKAEEAQPVTEAKKADGFKAMSKMVNGKRLSEEEKALITGDNATNNENYLVPTDVKLEINELRKTYVSAKELVTVEGTRALSGSVNYEKGVPSGLVAFEDGAAIAEETGIKFDQKTYTIKWKGKLIPVSRILASAEKAGLMSYIDRWFVKNAIISENNDIFATLKNGYNNGTPKAVAGWKALKSSINKDLDPSCLIGGVIATNQSGFDALDNEVDGNGRPILQPNPANPTEKLFQGLPIKVYPDSTLPNIDATHFPVFYGNTKAGATFEEYEGLEFGFSDQFLFNKNQNCLRVIEGYAVMSTDTSAYIYGSFSATV